MRKYPSKSNVNRDFSSRNDNLDLPSDQWKSILEKAAGEVESVRQCLKDAEALF